MSADAPRAIRTFTTDRDRAGPSPDSSLAGESATPQHRLPPRRTPPRPSRRDPNDGFFPGALFEQPTMVFVYGPSRPLVNLTLFALARETNPDFQWVDLGGSNTARAPCDPVRLGWIPDDRLWLVDQPDALRPGDRNANQSLFDMIRRDESPEALDRLTEFLSLPDVSQRIIAAMPSGGRPGVVAVTDADRLHIAISTDQVPWVLNVHRNAGFSVLVGWPGEAGAGRDLFDFVFRLQGKDDERLDWKRNQLVCEKGVRSGPLANLRPVRLEEIPLVADVISRARALPWPGEHPDSP